MMPPAPKVTIDPRGIAALFSTPQAVAVLADRSEAVKAEAERIAPHGFMGYAKQFTVGRGRSQSGGVPSIEAGNASSGWHLVEFGSVNNAPHRTLERATRAAGLEWREAT